MYRTVHSFSISVCEREKNALGGETLEFCFLPTNASFSVSFIIYCLAVLSAIRIQRGNKPPPLAGTHACSYDVMHDPGLPAAPTNCPTF